MSAFTAQSTDLNSRQNVSHAVWEQKQYGQQTYSTMGNVASHLGAPHTYEQYSRNHVAIFHVRFVSSSITQDSRRSRVIGQSQTFQFQIGTDYFSNNKRVHRASGGTSCLRLSQACNCNDCNWSQDYWHRLQKKRMNGNIDCFNNIYVALLETLWRLVKLSQSGIVVPCEALT